MLHFIAMSADERRVAESMFGKPDFVHPIWDVRAKQELAEGDRAVFGGGKSIDDEPSKYSFDDSAVH